MDSKKIKKILNGILLLCPFMTNATSLPWKSVAIYDQNGNQKSAPGKDYSQLLEQYRDTSTIFIQNGDQFIKCTEYGMYLPDGIPYDYDENSKKQSFLLPDVPIFMPVKGEYIYPKSTVKLPQENDSTEWNKSEILEPYGNIAFCLKFDEKTYKDISTGKYGDKTIIEQVVFYRYNNGNRYFFPASALKPYLEGKKHKYDDITLPSISILEYPPFASQSMCGLKKPSGKNDLGTWNVNHCQNFRFVPTYVLGKYQINLNYNLGETTKIFAFSRLASQGRFDYYNQAYHLHGNGIFQDSNGYKCYGLAGIFLTNTSNNWLTTSIYFENFKNYINVEFHTHHIFLNPIFSENITKALLGKFENFNKLDEFSLLHERLNTVENIKKDPVLTDFLRLLEFNISENSVKNLIKEIPNEEGKSELNHALDENKIEMLTTWNNLSLWKDTMNAQILERKKNLEAIEKAIHFEKEMDIISEKINNSSTSPLLSTDSPLINQQIRKLESEINKLSKNYPQTTSGQFQNKIQDWKNCIMPRLRKANTQISNVIQKNLNAQNTQKIETIKGEITQIAEKLKNKINQLSCQKTSSDDINIATIETFQELQKFNNYDDETQKLLSFKIKEISEIFCREIKNQYSKDVHSIGVNFQKILESYNNLISILKNFTLVNGAEIEKLWQNEKKETCENYLKALNDADKDKFEFDLFAILYNLKSIQYGLPIDSLSENFKQNFYENFEHLSEIYIKKTTADVEKEVNDQISIISNNIVNIVNEYKENSKPHVPNNVLNETKKNIEHANEIKDQAAEINDGLEKLTGNKNDKIKNLVKFFENFINKTKNVAKNTDENLKNFLGQVEKFYENQNQTDHFSAIFRKNFTNEGAEIKKTVQEKKKQNKTIGLGHEGIDKPHDLTNDGIKNQIQNGEEHTKLGMDKSPEGDFGPSLQKNKPVDHKELETEKSSQEQKKDKKSKKYKYSEQSEHSEKSISELKGKKSKTPKIEQQPSMEKKELEKKLEKLYQQSLEDNSESSKKEKLEKPSIKKEKQLEKSIEENENIPESNKKDEEQISQFSKEQHFESKFDQDYPMKHDQEDELEKHDNGENWKEQEFLKQSPQMKNQEKVKNSLKRLGDKSDEGSQFLEKFNPQKEELDELENQQKILDDQPTSSVQRQKQNIKNPLKKQYDEIDQLIKKSPKFEDQNEGNNMEENLQPQQEEFDEDGKQPQLKRQDDNQNQRLEDSNQSKQQPSKLNQRSSQMNQSSGRKRSMSAEKQLRKNRNRSGEQPATELDDSKIWNQEFIDNRMVDDNWENFDNQGFELPWPETVNEKETSIPQNQAEKIIFQIQDFENKRQITSNKGNLIISKNKDLSGSRSIQNPNTSTNSNDQSRRLNIPSDDKENIIDPINSKKRRTNSNLCSSDSSDFPNKNIKNPNIPSDKKENDDVSRHGTKDLQDGHIQNIQHNESGNIPDSFISQKISPINNSDYPNASMITSGNTMNPVIPSNEIKNNSNNSNPNDNQNIFSDKDGKQSQDNRAIIRAPIKLIRQRSNRRREPKQSQENRPKNSFKNNSKISKNNPKTASEIVLTKDPNGKMKNNPNDNQKTASKNNQNGKSKKKSKVKHEK